MKVTECAICGSRDYKEFHNYSFKYHSVICARCMNDETGERSVPIRSQVLYLAGFLKHVAVGNVDSISITEQNARHLLKFVELIYDEYTGVYFKSRRLLQRYYKRGASGTTLFKVNQ